MLQDPVRSLRAAQEAELLLWPVLSSRDPDPFSSVSILEGTVAFYWLCSFGCQARAGAGFLPIQPGSGDLPTPALHALQLGSACSPHAGRAQSQRESHCVSNAHALFPPAHSLPHPLPARRSSGGCAPGAHKAWHPASDPSWPPFPGSVEGRDYRPRPGLAVAHCLSRGSGISKLKGPWKFS